MAHATKLPPRSSSIWIRMISWNELSALKPSSRARRASMRCGRELGFKAEGSFDEIVRIHIDEDRGGSFVA